MRIRSRTMCHFLSQLEYQITCGFPSLAHLAPVHNYNVTSVINLSQSQYNLWLIERRRSETTAKVSIVKLFTLYAYGHICHSIFRFFALKTTPFLRNKSIKLILRTYFVWKGEKPRNIAISNNLNHALILLLWLMPGVVKNQCLLKMYCFFLFF